MASITYKLSNVNHIYYIALDSYFFMCFDNSYKWENKEKNYSDIYSRCSFPKFPSLSVFYNSLQCFQFPFSLPFSIVCVTLFVGGNLDIHIT